MKINVLDMVEEELSSQGIIMDTNEMDSLVEDLYTQGEEFVGSLLLRMIEGGLNEYGYTTQ